MDDSTKNLLAVGILLAGFLLQKAKGKINLSAVERIMQRWNAIETAAEQNGIPPEIIAGIIYVESRGDPNARGSSGEYGLMQLTPVAVRDLGLSRIPRRAERNILIGTQFLKLQLIRTGDLYTAVRAYNAGAQGALENSRRSVGYADQVFRAGEYFV